LPKKISGGRLLDAWRLWASRIGSRAAARRALSWTSDPAEPRWATAAGRVNRWPTVWPAAGRAGGGRPAGWPLSLGRAGEGRETVVVHAERVVELGLEFGARRWRASVSSRKLLELCDGVVALELMHDTLGIAL